MITAIVHVMDDGVVASFEPPNEDSLPSQRTEEIDRITTFRVRHLY